MRYLKNIGLAAMAALMASAMLASAASAQEATLTAGATPNTHEAADITAEQYPDPWEAGEEWNFFEVPGVADLVRCDTSILSGTAAGGTATNIKVAPEYIHCNAGSQAATVKTNGCEYQLTDPTTIEESETTYTGTVDLTCPEGKAIVVTAYLFGNATKTNHSFPVCTIEVSPNTEAGEHESQELGGHVIYHQRSDGPKDDITATVDVSGITVKDNCHSEESENGVYKQTLTVKAFEDGSNHEAGDQLDLWLSHG